MNQITRRLFLGQTAVLAGATGVYAMAAAGTVPADRKFTMDLVCGAIGVRANQREAIRLARLGGFESVQPAGGELEKASDGELESLAGELREANLVWGAAGMPVNFRLDDATFRNGLKGLTSLAKGLQRAGATRISTWLSPAHDELTYRANFRQHVERLREIAKIVGDCGLRFGLEYVGPKKSWAVKRFPFIHTMVETKELIAEIGQHNVGFVLDSWHWYTAQETRADLLTLTHDDVIACDLNDAPAGIPVDQQVDNQRELPAATGVIDLAAFLGALVEIGYDGPVRAEPFNQELRAMDSESAVRATGAALRKAFSLRKQ